MVQQPFVRIGRDLLFGVADGDILAHGDGAGIGGDIAHQMISKRVVLPEPLGPMTAMRSRAPTLKVTPLKKDLLTEGLGYIGYS